MAKTKLKKKDYFKNSSQYLISAAIGGVVAWLSSGDLGIGVIVFIAVWIGNKIAFTSKK